MKMLQRKAASWQSILLSAQRTAQHWWPTHRLCLAIKSWLTSHRYRLSLDKRNIPGTCLLKYPLCLMVCVCPPVVSSRFLHILGKNQNPLHPGKVTEFHSQPWKFFGLCQKCSTKLYFHWLTFVHFGLDFEENLIYGFNFGCEELYLHHLTWKEQRFLLQTKIWKLSEVIKIAPNYFGQAL